MLETIKTKADGYKTWPVNKIHVRKKYIQKLRF